MSDTPHLSAEQGERLLLANLDAWDRSNRALLHLLRALPEDGLAARALPGSPTIAEMFTHMHHERMISVFENAPECAGTVPAQEWVHEPDVERIAAMLVESGARVREAVRTRILADRPLDADFAHASQFLHFLIFHEGYHHGQIKLALKAVGATLPDEIVGPLIWDVWRSR